MAGDDTEAKATVAALIDELGFDVVDVGPLDGQLADRAEHAGLRAAARREGMRDALAAARAEAH